MAVVLGVESQARIRHGVAVESLMSGPRRTTAHFLEVEHGDGEWGPMTWSTGLPVWRKKRREAIRTAKVVIFVRPFFRKLRQFRAMRVIYRGQIVWSWDRKA
jgi:hypothetical protein